MGAEELIYPMKSNFVPYQWPTPNKILYFMGDDLDLSMLSLAVSKSSDHLASKAAAPTARCLRTGDGSLTIHARPDGSK